VVIAGFPSIPVINLIPTGQRALRGCAYIADPSRRSGGVMVGVILTGSKFASMTLKMEAYRLMLEIQISRLSGG